MKKQIIIKGNDITADILSLIAPSDWSIYKICSTEKKPIPYPYYANDISNGALKFFASQYGLPISFDFKKTVRNIVVITDNRKYVFPCSFEEFFAKLLYYFPQEHRGLQQMFDTFKCIGIEWRNWLANRSTSSISEMKQSAKYNRYTLNNMDLLFGIKNEEILNILRAFIPKKDATISVVSGYLFTQCFDINAFKEDIFQWIGEQAQDRLVVLHQESEFVRGTYTIVEPINKISDMSLFKNNSGYGTFILSDSDSTPFDNAYYISTSSLWMRIWNRKILNQKAEYEWAFEYISPKKLEDDVRELQVHLNEIFNSKVTFIQCYDNSLLADSLGTTIAGSFSWAFSPSESMHDPMSMLKTKCNDRISYGHWGYAWFVAAFDIYNQLSK